VTADFCPGAIQVVTTRRTAVHVAEVMCRCVRAGYHQTRQPVVPVGQVPSLLQACTSTTAFEEGRSRQRITSELQADIQLADVVEDPGEIGADTSSTTSVQLRQVQ